jgi:hypothetical protein
MLLRRTEPPRRDELASLWPPWTLWGEWARALFRAVRFDPTSLSLFLFFFEMEISADGLKFNGLTWVFGPLWCLSFPVRLCALKMLLVTISVLHCSQRLIESWYLLWECCGSYLMKCLGFSDFPVHLTFKKSRK